MRTVITYGTFDLFHRGHYNILKRAKEEGDYLIVGVTGETYDAERGKLSVQDSLAVRIENVKKTGFADKIIVEEYLGQKIQDIIKYHVDVFVIGSDWKGKFDHIAKYCEIKYLERTKDISSTQLREERLTIYRFGIVTDEMYDNEAVMESKIVSGIHIESVFSPDQGMADEFRDTYEINRSFSDYEAFLDSVDIVYVKTRRKERLGYVEQALKAGKHVISDVPVVSDLVPGQSLLELAENQNVIFMQNISTVYLHAFSQLLWIARSNLIGDLISIKCSISSQLFDERNSYDFKDLLYYPMCVLTKIFGCEHENVTAKILKDGNGEAMYGIVTVSYPEAVGVVEISTSIETQCEMRIFGTQGEIYIPDDWWRVGYFKVKQKGEKRAKNYSSNFEGNGFRYLLQALLQEIRAEGTSNARITEKESQAVLSLMRSVF